MKKLMIKWKHLVVEGETCDRCADTGAHLKDEIKSLNQTLAEKDIEIFLEEMTLEGDAIEESNEIWIDGVPIESILNLKVAQNYCRSCSDLLNTETYCRTVLYEGREYEEIPPQALHRAVYQVLGILEDTVDGMGKTMDEGQVDQNFFNVVSSCCNGGSNCC